jgi:hypothetical protein
MEQYQLPKRGSFAENKAMENSEHTGHFNSSP